jgi:ATP-dependent Clp protease ATP-binding subunit ClpC
MNNFTPRAQEVLALARKEAARLNHNFVGTEHLLLGLIALGKGVAVNVLQLLGLDLETVRLEVEKLVGTGSDPKIGGNIPYTDRVKKVLALAAKEAKGLNHTYVGTEHILLGLLGEGDGVAAQVMKNLGINLEGTRSEILKELTPMLQGSQPDDKQSKIPQKMDIPNAERDSIDVTKRYDVYCVEQNQDLVVYRNALFKDRKKLLSTRQHEFGTDFIESAKN